MGIPVLLAAAAIWLRPRAPLAWATVLYPALVIAVVVGTANHFVLDAAIGAACAALGVAGARLVHGRVPRGHASARPATIAALALAAAAAAFAVNDLLLRLGA